MRRLIQTAIIWPLLLATAAVNCQQAADPLTTRSHFNHQKPGSQVRLLSPSHFTMHQGQHLAAELSLNTKNVTGHLDIQLKVGSQLRLISNQTHWTFEPRPGREITLPIEILAENSGRHYVHIFVKELRENQTLTRALAIAIDVDTEKSRKSEPSSPVIYLPTETDIND